LELLDFNLGLGLRTLQRELVLEGPLFLAVMTFLSSALKQKSAIDGMPMDVDLVEERMTPERRIRRDLEGTILIDIT
jgi:hypothetical protein